MNSIEILTNEDLDAMSKGEMSDLLTDLIIEGAPESYLTRVVGRSMIVIDESKAR